MLWTAGLLSYGCSTAFAEPPLLPIRAVTLSPTVTEHMVPVVTAMAIDPTGGWIAVAGDDNAVRILSTQDFSQKAILHGHRDLVRSMHYRADGRALATAGNDGSLILWDSAADYSQLRRVDDLHAIADLGFSPDGLQLAAVGFNAEVMIFGGTKNRASMSCDCNDLRTCAFDPSGDRVFVGGRSGHVHVFHSQTGRNLNDYAIHKGRIRDCAIVDEGRALITVGEDGAAIRFDLARGEVTGRINVLPCKLFALAVIDSQQVAIAGSDNRIRLVDFEQGRVSQFLDGHTGSINSLIYDRGRLFSGGFDASLKQWGDQSARRASFGRTRPRDAAAYSIV